MRALFCLTSLGFIFNFANATPEVNAKGPLNKCVGHLLADGSVLYKEDCLSPNKTLVKKGVRPHVITGPVDTPQKAMELYNKTKEATTLVKDQDSSAL